MKIKLFILVALAQLLFPNHMIGGSTELLYYHLSRTGQSG